ncbi:MAG: hypothetical protein HZC41_03020 [Chloroflexi bacterium]|nr:hypothetical protein [Chloroflexota bacterium]
MRRLALILTLLALLGMGRTAAREIRQGDECIIPATEVIQDNLFVLCRVLTIDGRVEGNLTGAASVATINGSVTGDISLLAGELTFSGTAGENLHFVGPVLRIEPDATFENPTGDLVAVTLSTDLDAAVQGSVTNVGYELKLGGSTGGEVNFWGGALDITGTVGRDVNAAVADPNATAFSQWLNLLFPLFWDTTVQKPGLVVAQRGRIEGDLLYTGPVEGTISGQVAGETVFTPISSQPDLTQIIPEEQRGGRELGIYLSQVLQELLTLTVIGLIGLSLAYRPLQLPLRQMQARPLWSLGAGLLALIVGVLAVFVIAGVGILLLIILGQLQLTGLSLAASIVLIVATLGSSGGFALVVIFISRVLVALFMGRLIVRVAVGDDGSRRITTISLLVGVIVLALLASLPVIGWVINLAALLFGLGAIAVHLIVQLRPAYERVPVLVYRAPDSAPPPPPIIEDSGKPPGMDNLPAGFRWWDD